MSSPSTALYHLEKLRELGVTEKDEIGQYSLKEQVQVGTLRMFFKIGRLILPRYLFYAIFLTTAVVVYAAERIIQMGTLDPAAVVFGVDRSRSVLVRIRQTLEGKTRLDRESHVRKCRLNPFLNMWVSG